MLLSLEMKYVTFIKELTKKMCRYFNIYIAVECDIRRFIFSKANFSFFQVEFSHSEKSSRNWTLR